MSEVVNLNRARKARARADAAAKAQANRALFGLPKAEKETARRLRQKAAAEIEAHKHEP